MSGYRQGVIYKVGQACLNGHKITGDAASGRASPFCPTCGAETITNCPNCSSQIRGDLQSMMTVAWSSPPAHCFNCGKPYPWTQAKLNAVNELANAIEELTDFERDQLAELMPHLIEETPRTAVAGFKVATIWSKMVGPGKAVLHDILLDIAVDAGKKSLGFA